MTAATLVILAATASQILAWGAWLKARTDVAKAYDARLRDAVEWRRNVDAFRAELRQRDELIAKIDIENDGQALLLKQTIAERDALRERWPA